MVEDLELDRPTKKKKLPYFGKSVEEAIIQYNNSEDKLERHKLFEGTIHKALDELVQNNIFNALRKNAPYYTDTSYDDLKTECVVYLYDRIRGYDPNLGRAFSYFNRISLNFLIANSQRVYKNLCDSADLNCIDSERDLILESNLSDSQAELRHFLKSWSRDCVNRIEILFPNKMEQKVANAIFNLFENVEYLDIYNKKALYILIREQVNCKTHTITKVVSEISEFFAHQYKRYLQQVRDDIPTKNNKTSIETFTLTWIRKLNEEEFENDELVVVQYFKENFGIIRKKNNNIAVENFIKKLSTERNVDVKAVKSVITELFQNYDFHLEAFRRKNV